jgi:catechol 2,3-dioxygenase-like lactoylglutathione lyase family enzyme
MTEKVILIPELKVFDFQESLNFYTELAGFEILYDRIEEEFAMLEINGARLMIESLTSKRRTWEVGVLERPLGRGINFQIEIPNVQILYEKFKQATYPIFFEIEEKWYRKKDNEVGHRQFLVQDPDGYLLRFFQDLGMKSIKESLIDEK